MNELYFINRLITYHNAKITKGKSSSEHILLVYGVIIMINKENFTFDNAKLYDNDFTYQCRYPKNDYEFKNFIKEIKYIGSDEFVTDTYNDVDKPSYISKMYIY